MHKERKAFLYFRKEKSSAMINTATRYIAAFLIRHIAIPEKSRRKMPVFSDAAKAGEECRAVLGSSLQD